MDTPYEWSINRAVEKLIKFNMKFVILIKRTRSQKFISHDLNQLSGISEFPKGRVPPFPDQKQLLLSFSTAIFIADRSKETEPSKRSIKTVLVSKG